MRVRTIKEHEANLAQIRETWVRRNEAQMEDAALSVWSDQCRADGERFAIDLLKNGIEQCGKEIPMAWFRFLLDADDNHVDAKEIVTKDGRIVWILGDAAEAQVRQEVHSLLASAAGFRSSLVCMKIGRGPRPTATSRATVAGSAGS